MANYVIKGTVSKLTKKKTEKEITVKIVGSEGYAIKHGEKAYNVFCPEDMSKKYFHGHIVDPKIEFSMDEKFENILMQAFTNGKKIRLTVSENAIEKYLQKCADSDTQQNADDKDVVDIQSVSLLQK